MAEPIASRTSISTYDFNEITGTLEGHRPQIVLDAPPFARTASIVGNRRCIFDLLHGDPRRLQGSDCRFATRARPLHANLNFLNPILRSLFGSLLCRHLTSKRGAFPRSLEATRSGTRPTNRVTLGIGDRHLRVVERRLDERDRRRDITPNLAPLVSRVLFVLLLFRHDILFNLTC